MRINSINLAQPRNLSCKMKTGSAQKKANVSMPPQEQQVSFKGGKACFWGIVGTLVGSGAAALFTGGAALLPVLLGGAVGAEGGCIYGKSKENNRSDDDYIDYDPCYPNYRDN